MGWSEFEMNRKNTKLNNAKLKTLPLGKSVCDGNNLYFTRTGDAKGKFTFRYQRLGKKNEMGLGPWPAISLAEARQEARDAHTAIHKGLDPLAEDRLRDARGMINETGGNTLLAADGGIREHTVPRLRRAGADTIVMGSLAFGAEDLAGRMAWVHSQKGPA